MSDRRSWLHIASLLILLGLAAVIAPVLADTASVINVPGDQPTIQAAVLAAADGDTIVIAAGTYPGGITIVGKSLTLQGAGAGLTFLDGGGTQQVMHSDSNLTLLDLTVQNGGGSAATTGVYATGNLTLTRSHFLSNTVTSVIIAGQGAGALSSGNVAAYDCRFQNNLIAGFVSGQGAGLCAYGSAQIVNCVFEENQISTPIGSGAGLAVHGPSTISGSRFVSNTLSGGALTQGGGFWTPSDATISNSQFISNSATAIGGGLYSMGTMTVTGSLFDGNTTAGNGGGAAVIGDVAISDTEFRNCEALYGGGLGVTMGDVSLTRARFIANTAGMGGGGAVVLMSGSVETIDCLFQDNQALETDPILYSPGGGGLLLGNEAQPPIPGALQADLNPLPWVDTFTTTLRSTVFRDNEADGPGGGVSSFGVVHASDCVFEGNASLDMVGGGLFQQPTMPTLTADGAGWGWDQGHGWEPMQALVQDLIPDTAGISDPQAFYDLFDELLTSPELEKLLDEGLPWADALPLDGLEGDPPAPPVIITFPGVYMTRTQVISNVSPGPGGGVCATGEVEASECLFQYNISYSAWGGGLTTMSGADLSATRFISNAALIDGGGASVDYAATVDDCHFEWNMTLIDGGGLSVYGLVPKYMVLDDAGGNALNDANGFGPFLPASTVMTDTTFVHNIAVGLGGGLSSHGPLTATQCTWTENGALLWGGGVSAVDLYIMFNDYSQLKPAADGCWEDWEVYVAPVTVTLDSCQFHGNLTGLLGAGITALGQLNTVDSRFETNRTFLGLGGGAAAGWVNAPLEAVDGGLTLANDGPPLPPGFLETTHTISRTAFISNTGGLASGGLFLVGMGVLEQSTFERNAALLGGGVVGLPFLGIEKCRFEENLALGPGAGVLGMNVIASNSLFADNEAIMGEAHAAAAVGGPLIVNAPPDQILGRYDLLPAEPSIYFVNCTMANREKREGSALGFVASDLDTIGVENCIIAQFTKGITVPMGFLWENNNLFDSVDDPLCGGLMSPTSFEAPAAFIDQANGDFHLAGWSPAIDAGIPYPIFDDLDLMPRDLLPDLGCYESTDKLFNVTVGPNPFCPSWDLYYDWHYSPEGIGEFENVTVSLTLPPDTCCPSEWLPGWPTWSYDEPSRTVTWDLGTVASGATVAGTIKIHSHSSIVSGQTVTGTFVLKSDSYLAPIKAQAVAEADAAECPNENVVPDPTPTPTATPSPPGFFCLPIIVVS